jgi:hypothetical protein
VQLVHLLPIGRELGGCPAKHIGGPLEQLSLPAGNLGGMDPRVRNSRATSDLSCPIKLTSPVTTNTFNRVLNGRQCHDKKNCFIPLFS